MIEFKGVSKVYGKGQNTFTALRDVSFIVPDNTTLAIVGKSGSGKSTLMHLLGGLDTPTEGEIIVNGHNLGTLKSRAMDKYRARELGFVFQSFFVEANQTCYQNVVLPLEINEVSFRRRRKLVTEALEQVELADKINQKAGNLSGGQKQRLAIARAIVSKPGFIMADEPTGNLDSATGEKIIKLLFSKQRTSGNTLIIVTHDNDLARRCDMQISLHDGKIVATRRPAPVNQKGTKI